MPTGSSRCISTAAGAVYPRQYVTVLRLTFNLRRTTSRHHQLMEARQKRGPWHLLRHPYETWGIEHVPGVRRGKEKRRPVKLKGRTVASRALHFLQCCIRLCHRPPTPAVHPSNSEIPLQLSLGNPLFLSLGNHRHASRAASDGRASALLNICVYSTSRQSLVKLSLKKVNNGLLCRNRSEYRG